MRRRCSELEIDMQSLVGLDFETYASTDLLGHGLARYVGCPDFMPLMAAVASRDADGRIVDSVFDFVLVDYEKEKQRLVEALHGRTIVAHNAGFEQAVLSRMGIDVPSERFVDSAVLARMAGAAGKLEAAAPQMLGVDKLESGLSLIKLFSIPGDLQQDDGSFDPAIVRDNLPEWAEFMRYCELDAELSLRLAMHLLGDSDGKELLNNAVTMDMNAVGWNVDISMVEVMQEMYLRNVDRAVQEFRDACGAEGLNLSSTQQMQAWCRTRGVRAVSFDEAHVASMLAQLERKLATELTDDRRRGYEHVVSLLRTKQIMGGSSLKKLQTILDTVGPDGRLHDQYLHCGAGATYRTTGRGVQMQNLKRLNGEGDDMMELYADAEWDNGRLAANLRQVFTASDPQGFLIVGDFSSVESRGLAWQAGEQWKLDAYSNGLDLYKVQAGQMFGKPVEKVDKQERQLGKVGELACGYGAGPQAVKDFAEKMGVPMSEAQAAKLVHDWRNANPCEVRYWADLHAALTFAVEFDGAGHAVLPHGSVRITPIPAPDSLRRQTGDPDLRSLRVELLLSDGSPMLSRVIHGTHMVGRNVHYWKPSERKTGDLWVDTWVNPKTKRRQPFTVYGGKLAGLLTQSLCREVFFDSLRSVAAWCASVPNVELVGQFHDEIVLDWTPGDFTVEAAMDALRASMTRTVLPGFPLAAEIKKDFRYTK